MMRFTLVGLAMLALTGCQTTQPVVRTEVQLLPIPQDLLSCSGVTISYPDPSTLTDREVARALVQLDTKLRTCRDQAIGIVQYQGLAKAQLGGGVPVPK